MNWLIAWAIATVAAAWIALSLCKAAARMDALFDGLDREFAAREKMERIER